MAATPASMLHIVAYGLQDRERLNAPKGQPSVKFYTSVLRRRTRWASQWRRVDFDNQADFGKKAIVTLPILGELITRASLVIQLPDIYSPQLFGTPTTTKWSWTNSVGHAICSQVEMTIGGQVIDRFDSRLLEVIDEQTRPVEHFDSTNAMIFRDAEGYSDESYLNTLTAPESRVTRTPTLEIIFPFWWNRGPGPQALPIQALAKDKVQISVNFRPVQQCVYTSSRAGALLPGPPGSPLPSIAGCPFLDANGDIIPGHTMPTEYNFEDAYWIVEYVSLEDREAAAFRMADLQIPIEQHIAVPISRTGGASSVRIPLNQGGLVRDMTWVAQRVEAPSYNAHFLFSRDLGDPPVWWPDAQLPNWDYGDGYIRPGFSDRASDPISAATMWIRGVRRFEHEGPSFFRSLIPALNCGRTPLINRYIYRYDFGFWPTGGLAEALTLARDEVRGFANWDLLPQKELVLTMNSGDCPDWSWETDTTQPVLLRSGEDGWIFAESSFASTTTGFRVTLQGAKPDDATPNNGNGAVVRGIIDYQALRRIPGFQALVVRPVENGSAGLAVKTMGGYMWLAMAGGGGRGSEAARGGDAGSAVEIAWQGGGAAQTHVAVATSLGGGGGGRIPPPAPGDNDGTMPPTTNAFVLSGLRTGGSTELYEGGDGWGGGGSGSDAGGGGGSYVSRYISEVETFTDMVYAGDSYVRLEPLRSVRTPKPDFNIYVWLTRYNMLRITAGRGTLMFSE
jgi:hypothetical protein